MQAKTLLLGDVPPAGVLVAEPPAPTGHLTPRTFLLAGESGGEDGALMHSVWCQKRFREYQNVEISA